VDHTAGTGELRRDLRDQLRPGDAARRVEPERADLAVQPLGDGNVNGAARARARRQADERLVDRQPFDIRGFAPEELVDLQRGGEAGVERAVEEDTVGTPERRVHERHADADPALSRLAGRGRDHAAAAGLAADHDRAADQFGLAPALNRDEERIEIEMEYHVASAFRRKTAF
jgi:hypothetical protein